MGIEFEAKFLGVDVNKMRHALKVKGAKLIAPERLMRRALFGAEFDDGRWLRLRDEGNKVTLTFKDRSSRSIGGTREAEVVVSDFDTTYQILKLAQVPLKAYQENKRESWGLDGAQVEIDTWPGVSPYVEIEAGSKEAVEKAAIELEFDFSAANFDSPDQLYAQEQGITEREAFERFDDLRFE